MDKLGHFKTLHLRRLLEESPDEVKKAEDEWLQAILQLRYHCCLRRPAAHCCGAVQGRTGNRHPCSIQELVRHDGTTSMRSSLPCSKRRIDRRPSAPYCSCAIPFKQYLLSKERDGDTPAPSGKPFLSYREAPVGHGFAASHILRRLYGGGHRQVEEEKLAEALKTARSFRLVSTHYFDSRWCLGECVYAL